MPRQPPGRDRRNQVVSANVSHCFTDQEINAAKNTLHDAQLRRMPVTARGTGMLIGIVACGDVVTRHPAEVDRTHSGISTPSASDHS